MGESRFLFVICESHNYAVGALNRHCDGDLSPKAIQTNKNKSK